MTALLALIPTKDWIYGGIIVAILVGGTWYHHKLITEGVEKQKAADAIERKNLEADTAKLTAELQARATTAEQAYDKEHIANLEPKPTGPVRLCVATNNSGKILPQAGGTNRGDESAGAPAANVPEVPSGNNSGGPGAAGPDISGMLQIFAAHADDVSAVLREFQNR
jgi:hypothetical protein